MPIDLRVLGEGLAQTGKAVSDILLRKYLEDIQTQRFLQEMSHREKLAKEAQDFERGLKEQEWKVEKETEERKFGKEKQLAEYQNKLGIQSTFYKGIPPCLIKYYEMLNSGSDEEKVMAGQVINKFYGISEKINKGQPIRNEDIVGLSPDLRAQLAAEQREREEAEKERQLRAIGVASKLPLTHEEIDMGMAEQQLDAIDKELETLQTKLAQEMEGTATKVYQLGVSKFEKLEKNPIASLAMGGLRNLQHRIYELIDLRNKIANDILSKKDQRELGASVARYAPRIPSVDVNSPYFFEKMREIKLQYDKAIEAAISNKEKPPKKPSSQKLLQDTIEYFERLGWRVIGK